MKELCFHLLEVGLDVGLRDRNLLEAAVERLGKVPSATTPIPRAPPRPRPSSSHSLARNNPFVAHADVSSGRYWGAPNRHIGDTLGSTWSGRGRARARGARTTTCNRSTSRECTRDLRPRTDVGRSDALGPVAVSRSNVSGINWESVVTSPSASRAPRSGPSHPSLSTRSRPGPRIGTPSP